ncbi:hypothetical protein QJS04_geneDACA012408 [Acorus gramineus]|uniref:Alcohol dehydrogenase-like N-terminal domain-containing protein n=1 Tax=Acorus gramineus TaxID=55184 RepID=A0AAV9BB60_ACOGR|nr:hypothetical protein QJS04_geneDACA012408 [Acorus gramineus]
MTYIYIYIHIHTNGELLSLPLLHLSIFYISPSVEALLCRSIGDPTVPIADPSSPLTISLSHPVPVLQSPTSVRVRVRATSLNDANYLQILGKYQEKPPLPFVPGSDYSGVVDSVSRFRPGHRVYSFLVSDGCDLVAAGPYPSIYRRYKVDIVDISLIYR